METYFADIILPLALHQSYTYAVPAAFIEKLFVGARVIVPLGKHKRYTGIVLHIHQIAPAYLPLKSMEEVLDEQALVTEQQIAFWQWIAAYYMCSLGEVYKAALPAGLKLESETTLVLGDEVAWEELTDAENMVCRALKDGASQTIDQINQLFPSLNALPLIKRMLDKELLAVSQVLRIQYREKFRKFVLLAPCYQTQTELNTLLGELSKFKQQEKLLFTLLDLMQGNFQECILQSHLLAVAQVSVSVLKALEKKGCLVVVEQAVNRKVGLQETLVEAHALNQDQARAIGEIDTIFKEKNVCLLHGVTSSGKTEVYIHLIQAALKRNEQVLFLVPEIALTPQMTARLQRVFGACLGVYHSKFSDAERVELWNKQSNADQAYPIILGVRSSIFLPFHRLGLVLVDEEHESSYKQFDPNPRYHARDLAIVLAQHFNAKVLLGTATPSIETYYNALEGKYGLVEMMERHQNVSMPEIRSVNMAEAYRKKEHLSNFSAELLNEIELALDNKEQVILFQNRRGYASFVECMKCGHVPRCKHCEVSLTYYQHANRLACHYCGYSIGAISVCPSCKSKQLKTKGFGTEKIESELKTFFLDARVQRMDLDTTRSKHAFEQIIKKFETHQLDVLVGTQMLSKGLDFAGVHVVGIMNADNMLNFPDFRAHERAYQLMAQVSGRAGRSKKKGLVILQTNQPEHAIIQQVISNDYVAMYEDQISERKLFRYPPFYRLIKVSMQHANKNLLHQAMQVYAGCLREQLGNRILGPEWPVINRIKNKYVKCLLVKIEKEASLTQVKAMIANAMNEIQQQKAWNGIRFVIDVDPL